MIRSDLRNKEIALGRIKRLASSGLPLEPFARSAFELLHDGIPHSENRSLLVAGGSGAGAFVGSTSETVAAVVPFQHFFVERPEISGARFAQDMRTIERILPLKSVWAHEEIARPNYLRSEGFNAVMRPLRWHHHIEVVCQENGKFFGYFPLWRAEGEKPFTRLDADFLRAAAPHLAHGVKVAQLKDDTAIDQDGFATLSGWHSGVIMMDSAGTPIAIDSAATRIFHQLGVLDGLSSDIFGMKPVREALDYIRLTLKKIFVAAEDFSSATAPVYRLHHHRSGIVLKLRGIQMLGTEGAEYFTVLVERGETAEHRYRRITARWGLSEREAEVLALIGQGKTGPEISILLNISHDTARKHLAHIFEKLGVENRTEAALIARDAS
jgi:DNA-binding CsgD family transcriptional regulator